MKITLFFTYGVSLETWVKSGLLQREIKIYLELMKKYGIEVQFLTYGNSSDRNWEGELGGIKLLPVYERISHPSSKLLALFQTLIIPWVYRNELRKTDLLKTNQIWGGWVGVLTKWFFHKPLIVRCGYEFYNFSRMEGRSKIFQIFVYWISRLIYSQADQIQVASSSDYEFVEEVFGISSSFIEISPNWVDVQLFKPIPVQQEPRVLFVGRLNKQKNISLLLKALQGTNISLDVIGEGELRPMLEQEANSCKVDVNFIGCLQNDQLPRIYNAHPIFVICSCYEGNPKTLLEAMACGSAVVGTEVPGIQEIIQNGHSGLLVPEKPDALREAIQSLFASKEFSSLLGQNARKKIVEKNSLPSIIRKEIIVYRKLLD